MMYECKFCGKQFNKNGLCVIHEKYHCYLNPDRAEYERSPNYLSKGFLKAAKEGGWTCHCGKNFRTRKELQEHRKKCNACKTNGKLVKKKTYIKEVCPFCKEEKYTTLEGFKNHCRTCVQNPNRKVREITEETRAKLSAAAKKRHLGGLNETGGKSKKGYYKGIWCDSSWELAYVIYNLEHNISFERNKEKFEYLFEGKEHNYYPDFKEGENYVEIKGLYTDKVYAKISQFPCKLKVLDEKNIEPYINYVKQKYGDNFIRLYEDYKEPEKEKLKKEEKEKKEKLIAEEWLRRKNMIINSNVDLGKFGYVEKLVKCTGLTKRQIRNTILKYDIEHFEKKRSS